jgi:hypothetical protein
MFYFGKHYTVTKTATGAAEFVCKACHFRSAVRLVATGEGVGVNPYLLAEKWARREAHRAAVQATEEELRHMADFVPLAACPRCGKRDAQFVADFWGRAALLMIAAIAVFGALGYVLPMIDPGPAEGARWLAKVGATISVAYIGYTHVRRWLAVKNRLHFVDVDEVPENRPAT